MSFGPDERPFLRKFTVQRTVLFWVLIIALAVVLWQMASTGSRSEQLPKMSYSDFMGQVDKNNVGAVRIFLSPSTAEVQGQLRQPPDKFEVTVPKEVIPDLTERLRKQGTTIQVIEARESAHMNQMLDWLPFVIIIVSWILVFIFRNRHRRSATNDSANRPLG